MAIFLNLTILSAQLSLTWIRVSKTKMINRSEIFSTFPWDYMMRMCLFVLILTLANRVSADCRNLCSETWWISATSSELISELENGADVNARNRADDGKTPLHYAAQHSNSHEHLQTLLQYGAKLKARARNNLTALHTAAAFGTPDKIKVS